MNEYMYNTDEDEKFSERYNKWHKRMSYIKSAVRIITCAITVFTGSVAILALGLLIAEIIGIVEEWV